MSFGDEAEGNQGKHISGHVLGPRAAGPGEQGMLLKFTCKSEYCSVFVITKTPTNCSILIL